MNENDTKEGLIRKVLSKEVVFVLAVLSIAYSFYNTFASPTSSLQAEFSEHVAVQNQSLETIKSEMNAIRTGDFADIKRDVLENRDAIVNLSEEMVRLTTIINERIPAKR